MRDLLDVLRAPTRRARRTRSAIALGLFVAALLVPLAFRGRSVVRAAVDAQGIARVEGWASEIRAAALESGVEAELLAGVMYAESRGKVDALSSANAMGLMQLALGSAQDAARRLGLPAPERETLLSDGALNVRLGANHIAWLLRHEGPDPVRVLVAYNAGRSKVQRWAREAGSWEQWRASRERAGDSKVLAYARAVLDAREEFRRRGRLAGAP